LQCVIICLQLHAKRSIVRPMSIQKSLGLVLVLTLTAVGCGGGGNSTQSSGQSQNTATDTQPTFVSEYNFTESGKSVSDECKNVTISFYRIAHTIKGANEAAIQMCAETLIANEKDNTLEVKQFSLPDAASPHAGFTKECTYRGTLYFKGNTLSGILQADGSADSSQKCEPITLVGELQN
jgi:hypothetical protein